MCMVFYEQTKYTEHKLLFVKYGNNNLYVPD